MSKLEQWFWLSKARSPNKKGSSMCYITEEEKLRSALGSAAELKGFNDTLVTPASPSGRVEFNKTYRIPARQGRAVILKKNEYLVLANPTGRQVCDLWAFNAENQAEYMSMEHSRTALNRTIPREGDKLVTNRRRPILEVVADSSAGIHDTVIAACDVYRYEELGVEGYHDNCSDNMRMAMYAIGITQAYVPSPFNVWMNVPVEENGDFRWLPPVSKERDEIVLKACMPTIIAMSACPQDITVVNGDSKTTHPLDFLVKPASSLTA